MDFQDTSEIARRYPGAAGRLVTAEEVNYAIERYRDLAGGPGRDYVLNRLDHVEAVDQFTVKVVNQAPRDVLDPRLRGRVG